MGDGAAYIVKAYSSAGNWPLQAEWICARLGRLLGLPIPNYRQVWVSEELTEAWLANGGHFIEPGLAFGSQYVNHPADFNEELLRRLSTEDQTRLIAFDWWIRNADRTLKNPNLVWSHLEARHYIIDHEKAGDHRDSDAFWHDHLCAKQHLWLPESTLSVMRQAVGHIPAIKAELPAEWTSKGEELEWFFTHLKDSVQNQPTRDWRPHD